MNSSIRWNDKNADQVGQWPERETEICRMGREGSFKMIIRGWTKAQRRQEKLAKRRRYVVYSTKLDGNSYLRTIFLDFGTSPMFCK